MTRSATTQSSTQKLSWPAVLGYSSGSMGVGIVAAIPSFLLLFFMTETLGISALIAGVIASVPRFIDIFIDPLIGHFSDQTQKSAGSRRFWLLFGLIGATLCATQLFWVPEYSSQILTISHVAIVYTLLVSFTACYAIPYIAIPGDIDIHHHQKEDLITGRLFFSVLGLLLAGSTASPIIDHFGGGRDGYAAFSLFLSGILLITMMITLFTLAKQSIFHIDRSPQKKAFSWQNLLNKHELCIVIGYGLHIVGIGLSLGSWPYYATSVLGDSSLLGALFITTLLSTLVSMPIWNAWLSTVNARTAYFQSGFIYATGASVVGLCLYFDLHFAFSLVGFAICGAAVGGFQVAGFSILAALSKQKDLLLDIISAGSLAGVWMSTEKIGYAVSPFFIGMVLFMGQLLQPLQNDYNELSIVFLLVVLPSLLNIASASIVKINCNKCFRH